MIEIRRALPEEADTLTEIALAAKRHWSYPEGWMEIWTTILTFKPQDIEEADIFVAALQGEIVGFYRLFFRESRAVLEDLWIKPLFIGQSIGRVLFEHVVARCRLVGAQILAAESDPHAQGFYEKMGMHKVGERPSVVDGRRNLPILEMEL